jgi:two-component system NtrC family sensor kinase
MMVASPVRARLLVVEDSPLDRSIYRQTLRQFDVEFATSGEIALGRLAVDSFDLVVLDYNLPGLDGDLILTEIRDGLRLEVPVVVVTGGGSADLAVDLFRRGATDYATKDDIASNKIVTVITRAMDRHRRDHRRAVVEVRDEKESTEVTLRRLLETQAQLVQSEKMASLGQLVAGVAHEINNPLAYVSNNLAVLERDVRHIATLIDLYRDHFRDSLPQQILEAEQVIDLPYTLGNLDRLLKSSKQGLTRVQEIVGKLRDFSRLDEAHTKDIDPNEIIRDTLAIVRYSLLEKRIDLEVDLADLPTLLCNPGKLNQVILNIMLNAIQAVDFDAVISIRSRLDAGAREIVFEIADTGPGIPEPIRSRIFDPFFTTKTQGVGTGLGLWVSYSIVKEHGGRIEVESREGVGSTFRIRLPLEGGARPD